MVLYVPAYFGKKMYRSDDQRLMALVGGGESWWKRLESKGLLLKVLFSYSQSFGICMSINKINIK